MKDVCNHCNSVKSITNKDVTLDTRITPTCFAEGIIAEIRRIIQSMRKEAGYDVTDRIIVCTTLAQYYNLQKIKDDVLAVTIIDQIHKGLDLEKKLYGESIGIKKI